MERKLSKRLLLILLKHIPWILASGYIIYVVISTFGVSTALLTNIFGLSLIPAVFILICSLALGFCVWHRLPIYFTIISDGINLYDFSIGIPFSIMQMVSLYCGLFGITVLISIWLKNRYNVKKRNFENGTT